MPTSRFTIAGTDYDYETDVLRIEWERGADDYLRLDEVIDIDRREQRCIITFETVMVAANTNAESYGAADLYQLMETEAVNGNTITFVPDISISSGFNTNPPQINIVPRKGGRPKVREKEKGAERLQRSMTVQSDTRLDPTDTTAGGDKETIDDLNDLDSVL